MTRNKETLNILFLDVKGYSKLGSDYQFGVFFDQVIPRIAEKINPYTPMYVNSWGDAVIAVFKEPSKAARAALDLRDFFRDKDWQQEFGLTNDLAARIALHSGSVFVGEDPIQGRQGLAGYNVNLAARIEPIAQPNEVWVSEAFAILLKHENDSKIACDDLGERPLAKQWGSQKLFRLRRKHEPVNLNISDIEEVSEKASFFRPSGE